MQNPEERKKYGNSLGKEPQREEASRRITNRQQTLRGVAKINYKLLEKIISTLQLLERDENLCWGNKALPKRWDLTGEIELR